MDRKGEITKREISGGRRVTDCYPRLSKGETLTTVGSQSGWCVQEQEHLFAINICGDQMQT